MYEEEVSMIRRNIVYDETPPLETLDKDGDGKLTIRDLWIWKRQIDH